MRFFALSISVFVSSLCAACVSNASEVSSDIVQAYSARYSQEGDQITFANDFSVGPTAWLTMPNGLAQGLGEQLGMPLRDCRSAAYRCLAMESLVFVAPFDGMAVGENYQIGGAKIGVLSCESRVGSSCSRFFVRLDCQPLADDNLCPSQASLTVGPEPVTVYYIYDNYRGVVSFSDSGVCSGEGAAMRCNLEDAYVLQSESGLLAAVPSSQLPSGR